MGYSLRMSRRDGSSFRFKLVGVLVLAAVAGAILLLAVTGNFYAWGILGLSIIILVVMLTIFWYSDRRQVRQYEEDTR